MQIFLKGFLRTLRSEPCGDPDLSLGVVLRAEDPKFRSVVLIRIILIFLICAPLRLYQRTSARNKFTKQIYYKNSC